MTPGDTAWARFDRRDRGRAQSVDERFVEGLEQAAPALGLEAAHVALAVEVAGLEPVLGDDLRRALTLLLLTSMADVEQGCTRTPFDPGHLGPAFTALCRPAGSLDGQPAEVFAAALLDRVPALVEQAPHVLSPAVDAYVPLRLVGGWVYQQRMWVAEERLASALGRRAALAGRSDAVEDVVARVVADPTGVALSDEQQAAVAAAARERLTLVSGGPGTGKTSIVLALLQTFLRLGLTPRDIALAAPTGKAADRMGEAVGQVLAEPPQPATLHRLLGHNPRRETWQHHANHPLRQRLVVVDESSMVDVFLMGRLLDALRPDAHLVLLGDADQLPSVAAGAVFRDALAALPARRVRLTHSYRMRADDPAGRAVLQLANAVNRGDVGAWDGVPSKTLQTLAYAGVERLEAGERGFLERWYADHARLDEALRTRTWRSDDTAGLDAVFAHLSSARLLCVTRRDTTGAEQVNQRLHGLAASHARQPAAIPLLVGEPVMMLHNDYDRRLFNGDTGVVLFAPPADGDAEGPRPMAFFRGGPDGYRAFALETLAGRLALCYATTVHKSQGSEFDAVALLLPTSDGPLLTRELVYTAITRSRRGVVVVGSLDLAKRATARGIRRFSGLAERLGAGG